MFAIAGAKQNAHKHTLIAMVQSPTIRDELTCVVEMCDGICQNVH